MKLAEFNSFNDYKKTDSLDKPALIRNDNLAVATAIGALNGFFHIENRDELIKNSAAKAEVKSFFSPFDEKFYNFITSVKNKHLKNAADRFKNWLSPEKTRILNIGDKTAVSLKRIFRGAALFAALYVIPKTLFYIAHKVKENYEANK